MTEYKVEQKCWGTVRHVFSNDHVAVSCLQVKAGWRCSKHYHKERANQFTVLSGIILIEEWLHGSVVTTTRLTEGQIHTVPSGVMHRFVVTESGQVVEIYWPDKGGTVQLDDIVRLDEGGIDDGT